MTDPRPLLGEPLPLDLVNTRWTERGASRDLLDSLDGLAVWIESNDLTAESTPGVLEALLYTRDALNSLLLGETGGRRRLNEVLEHGRVRRTLGPGGPVSVPETDEPSWYPAWLAADGYLKLLDEAPDRIKPCAHPDCVLHFYDVSKNGTRRWCSMAGCGNRFKASRHYARQRHSAG
ncbi:MULTISPECIES: CGNR zinc finger domain-containing protein [Amycolatopsis]|uniref:CGNR zinc finger domain-containing protein n=1 Tax=Amycolatopsis dongchuanensis TaxID=1070866 RepID=A0ABP9QQM6_9PSEU